jgi:hypothetical protein
MVDETKRQSIQKNMRMEEMSLIIPSTSDGKKKADDKFIKAYKNFKRPAYTVRKD